MVKIPPELGFIRQSADVLTDERLTENADRRSLLGFYGGRSHPLRGFPGALSTSLRCSEVARCLSAFRTYSSRSNS
jgi:hypothetical protein